MESNKLDHNELEQLIGGQVYSGNSISNSSNVVGNVSADVINTNLVLYCICKYNNASAISNDNQSTSCACLCVY